MATPLADVPPIEGTCDRLYTFITGYELVPESWLFEGGDETLIRRVPDTCALVRSPDGWFLIDTGTGGEFRDPELSAKFWSWGDVELPGDSDPVIWRVAQCGVAPEEIACVVLTHAHVDHTGGLGHFVDGPPIVIQRVELEYALTPGGLGYWLPDMEEPGLRWQTMEGDGRIAAGIYALYTPGQSPGHMSIVVDMAESGRWILAGDALLVSENIERDVPIVFGSREEDRPAMRASHERLMRLHRDTGAPLLPGHSAKIWEALRKPPEHYT